MKRFLLIPLLLAVLLLPGCGTGQGAEAPYTSDTSAEDCYLCGGSIENLIPSYWGQNNLALISLNTFDIIPIETNRYDILTKQLIEEYTGTVSLGGGGSIDGGFYAKLMVDDDRGFADRTLNFWGDETLDIDKAAEFLCADCLNKILPSQSGRCSGVGAIPNTQNWDQQDSPGSKQHRYSDIDHLQSAAPSTVQRYFAENRKMFLIRFTSESNKNKENVVEW